MTAFVRKHQTSQNQRFHSHLDVYSQISDSRSEWSFVEVLFFSAFRNPKLGKNWIQLTFPNCHRLTVEVEVCLDLTRVVVKIYQKTYFIPVFTYSSSLHLLLICLKRLGRCFSKSLSLCLQNTLKYILIEVKIKLTLSHTQTHTL